MQFKTLGKSRWTALASKRNSRWEGIFVDIYDILADMKKETACPDNIITLAQFTLAISKNLKYLSDLEEKKLEKQRQKKGGNKEEEAVDETTT